MGARDEDSTPIDSPLRRKFATERVRSSVISEPPESRAATAREDRATIQAIKGKGIAVTFSSHFAIAAISAVGAFLAAHNAKEPSDSVGYQKAQECIVRIEKLEQAVTQWHNESTMHSQQTDTQLSLLVVRTDILLRKP